jgi:hypothetical protein
VKTKHRKTLEAIFARPTHGGIVFSEIEALVVSLGGQVFEREGSRVKIELKGEQWRCGARQGSCRLGHAANG